MMKNIAGVLVLFIAGAVSLEASSATIVTPAPLCPYGAALPDGCPGAPAGTPQLPQLLDVKQVTALSILPGSGYTNGTYTWTTSGGGGSGATGTITVAGGALGGSTGTSYSISNQRRHGSLFRHEYPGVLQRPQYPARLFPEVGESTWQTFASSAAAHWTRRSTGYSAIIFCWVRTGNCAAGD